MPFISDTGNRATSKSKPRKGTYTPPSRKRGFWENLAVNIDKAARGKNANANTARGAGVGRNIDNVATSGSGTKKYRGRISLPKGAKAAAARRNSNRYPTSSDYHATVKKYNKNLKNKKSDTKTTGKMNAYRADRIHRGLFKGDYYGPDAFKGDLALLEKWRGAGSPKNTAAFARKNRVKRNTGRGD